MRGMWRSSRIRSGLSALRVVVHHQHAPGRHRPASPATLPPRREARRGPPSAGRESARGGSSSQGAPT
jgi:hypothetical protein